MPDGLTQRDHLQAYAKSSGEIPPELIVPPLPGCLYAIWEIFLQLHHMRSGGMGPNAINASDLLAYQHLHGIALNPWELDCIHALDQVALKAASEQR